METTNRFLDLDDEEAKIVSDFFTLIDSIYRMHNRRLTQNIMVSFFRTIGELYARRRPDKTITKTRQEEYFEKFMRELSISHIRERSVQFYAEALHITPKYLSTVIKEISGRTAADWIDDFVIQEARAQLRFSTKSIQEIAYMLNFSTQSFFGKYFKRHTGMAPSEYRRFE